MTVRTKDEQKAYLDGFEMCADCIEKYLTDEGKQRIECLLMSVRNAVEIEDIEQQPCEDCISREATIEAIYKKYIGGKGAIENAPINDLYAEGLAEAVDAVWDMPSVAPTRPTAQWERVMDYNKCSNCGKLTKFYLKYNYCPNCGARIGESEKEI